MAIGEESESEEGNADGDEIEEDDASDGAFSRLRLAGLV